MFRTKLVAAAGLTALLAAALPPASRAASISVLHVMGQGTFTLSVPDFKATYASSDCATKAGLTCNNGDACQCVELAVPLQGNLGLNGSGPGLLKKNAGAMSLLFTADTSVAFDGGAGSACLPASGKGSVTSADSSSVLDFDTTGLFCNSASFGAVYTGGFTLTGGTNALSGASGTGALNLGLQFTSFDPSTGYANGGTNSAVLDGSISTASSADSAR